MQIMFNYNTAIRVSVEFRVSVFLVWKLIVEFAINAS